MIRLTISILPADCAAALRVRVGRHDAGVELALLNWGLYWVRLGDGEFMVAFGPLHLHAIFGDDDQGGGA